MTADGIIGFAVGDAFGVPHEFKTREQMDRLPNIEEMIGYGSHNMPEGTLKVDKAINCGQTGEMIAFLVEVL